jgi:hypothetical protein
MRRERVGRKQMHGISLKSRDAGWENLRKAENLNSRLANPIVRTPCRLELHINTPGVLRFCP